MRQVFLDKGNIVVREVSQPLLDDHAVLVSVHYSFISSGTEKATIANANTGFFSNVPHKVKKVLASVATNGFEGTAALIKGKIKGDIYSLGYSCAGQVIATGKKVQGFRLGDYVACAGSGYAHHADLVCVPVNLVVKLRDDKHIKAASITTIGAIALQGIRRAQIQLGETVCVIGLGLLGQLTVQLAKRAGCRVVGIDLEPMRLSIARDLGADAVFHPHDHAVTKEILMMTEHQGADATIITAASQSNTIAQQAMEVTRKKGRVVVVGDIGLSLQREPFYQKEIDFLMSCSYGPGRYDAEYELEGRDYPYSYVRWTENRNMQAFVGLVESGAINIDALITEEVDLAHLEQAYDRIKSSQTLGVVLAYSAGKKLHTSYSPLPQVPVMLGQQKVISFIPAQRDTIRVGFVGAGGFAKIKLLPLVSKIKQLSINAIVDPDAANALRVSRTYGASISGIHDDELYEKDSVDAVVIASPHHFHCDQALKSLNQGKAVFLEKPAVTTMAQLDQLEQFLKTHPHAPFCVDFNRSFAPFMQKIKKVTRKRAAPLMMHYRMNAGFVPGEHWIQSDLGAGRIIGEACHVIDLFCALTNARPVAVAVEALHTTRQDIFPTDNFVAHISFDDGSVGSLMYTALGSAKMGKERMEIFFDGKAIVMDDFVGLFGFGLPSWFNETTSSPDKGHEILINQFFNEIKKDTFTPPIPFERILTVSRLTLIIDQLACEGGGKKVIETVL